MTTQEFSNSFDTLLNSYAHKAEFGEQFSGKDVVLDEYEKSCFLTLAQEELVLSYYTGKNANADSFEKTEEIRRYLSSLVKTDKIDPEDTEDNSDDFDYNKASLTETSQFFELPEDLWFITYEAAELATDSSNACISGKEIQVIPTTQDDLYRTRENPFKGPGFRRALRLDISDHKVELISKYDIAKYIVRYVSKLSPIILEDLPTGLQINEETTRTECALHESLHKPILELAVKLALQSKGIQLQ